MIDVYVTHYVNEKLVGYNDIVIDCVMNLDEISRNDGVEFRLIVIFWAATNALEEDLRARLPPNVTAVRSRNHLQPFLMNEATRLAKEANAELFVCLHNDVRPSRGWLRNLVNDVRVSDKKHGRGSSIASPRYIPYHWLEPHPKGRTSESFWDRLRPEVEAKVLSVDRMARWCAEHGFSFDGQYVVSPKHSYTTDDGHQLMMYCAAPQFFDEIGACDESFAGLNFGDCDWGVRALQAGKMNLISQGCLLGHLSGLTFFNPSMKLDDNHQRFIDKWGMDMFQRLQDGSLWRHLRGKS